jgi:hypothetical protein
MQDDAVATAVALHAIDLELGGGTIAIRGRLQGHKLLMMMMMHDFPSVVVVRTTYMAMGNYKVHLLLGK